MTEAQKDHNWIMAIIDSCNNTFHFECVDRLIDLYAEKHNNAMLSLALLKQREVHFNNVHSIIK